MSINSVKNISFGKNLFTLSESKIRKSYKEAGEKVIPLFPEIKNIAEKTSTNIHINFDHYWFNPIAELDSLEVIVQKPAKNKKDVLKNLFQRLNIYSKKDKLMFLPNNCNFNANNFVADIKKLAEKVGKIKI